MQENISGMAQFLPWIVAAVALLVAFLAVLRGGNGGGRFERLLEREAQERSQDVEYHRAHLSEVERVLSGRLDQFRLETSERLSTLARNLGQDQAEDGSCSPMRCGRWRRARTSRSNGSARP